MHDLYGHIFVESTVAAIFLLGKRSTRTFQRKKKINSHAMYVRLAGTRFFIYSAEKWTPSRLRDGNGKVVRKTTWQIGVLFCGHRKIGFLLLLTWRLNVARDVVTLKRSPTVCHPHMHDT